MKVSVPLVPIIDGDPAVHGLVPGVKTLGFSVQAFSSAVASLFWDLVGKARCLMPDVAMPGMTRPDLQTELACRNQPMPVVYVTAPGDDWVTARLLEARRVSARSIFQRCGTS